MYSTHLPTVLAVETSTQACSVALIHHDKEFVCHELLPQKHAHRVLEMVDEVITQAGIAHKQIDLLAYGEGPGAFTGIRIATGVIQGLALGWDRPVLPVSSLLAMARKVCFNQVRDKSCKWYSLLDARMNEVYLLQGEYCSNSRKLLSGEPILISPPEVENHVNMEEQPIGIGDIEEEYPGLPKLFSEWHSELPEAVSIARVAQEKSSDAKTLMEEIPSPLYLRNHIADTIAERKIKAQQKQK
ncbi:MAG: tRNA (adenosine(37)-N6)-threonylcarbamoyltransferase complex dimerization subunit type 1 TsaB [Thiomicrorhabdus sp.]|nr:tRNA (adenosine(37)-N6)-threonylcarbamoyltransferase complex dimerization subunit type 1 TsaB [Thiomicrorhabdus sp.]